LFFGGVLFSFFLLLPITPLGAVQLCF
jgi:hypothetical protein